MNTLSLLIYLAGVAGTLNGFLVFLATIFGILALVALGVWIFSFNNTDSNQRPFPEHILKENREDGKKGWRWFWVFIMLMISTGVTAALVPSRQTVLLIAASEMGEQVLNHPRVNQVVDPGLELLTTWMQAETRALRRSMEDRR